MPLVIVAPFAAADGEREVAANRVTEPIDRDLERGEGPVQIDLPTARPARAVIRHRDMMPLR